MHSPLTMSYCWHQNQNTFPWLVVQLKPRFFASSPQSKPFRCKIKAVSREGTPSSYRGTWAQIIHLTLKAMISFNKICKHATREIHFYICAQLAKQTGSYNINCSSSIGSMLTSAWRVLRLRMWMSHGRVAESGKNDLRTGPPPFSLVTGITRSS